MYHALGQTLTLFLWLASCCCMIDPGTFTLKNVSLLQSLLRQWTPHWCLPLTPREINLGALLVSSKPRPDIEIWCPSPGPRRLEQCPHGASSKVLERQGQLIWLCFALKTSVCEIKRWIRRRREISDTACIFLYQQLLNNMEQHILCQTP